MTASASVCRVAWALLFSLSFLLSAVAGQSSVQEGSLSNGRPVQAAISQGESHYWTYVVSPADPLTGSPLLDLLFVLQVSSGLVTLQLTDPSGAAASSGTYASTGALYTNRSSSAVLYGVYSLQVYCVQSDVYTLSVSMTRRQQLACTEGGLASAGASTALLNSVGGVAVNGSSAALLLNTFAYADFWYNDTAQPPVQLTVTLTVDTAALQLAGVDLATVQLPSLYWAQGVDVPAWSPAAAATWDTAGLTSAGQLSAVVSTFSDCDAPPCRYSFLVVPLQSMPALPLLTLTLVDLDAPYDASLDFTQGGLTPAQLLGEVSLSTALTAISANGVHYYQFPVLDSSETLLLQLLSPQPSSGLLLLMSMDNEFPDLLQYSWQLASGAASQQLLISLSDPYFSQAGAQVRSMEGLYQLAVVAQTAGSYQLQLNLTDRSNGSAPLVLPSIPVTGVLQPGQVTYYRFLAPSTSSSQRYDLHFTVTNCSLFLSDWYSTPGPAATDAQNNVAAYYDWYYYGAISDFYILLGQAGQHAGVYYIGLASRWRAPAQNYQLVVTFTPHTLLSPGSIYASAAPLVAPAPLYFEYSQTGQTTQTLQLVLTTHNSAEFGSLYANLASHNNPNSATQSSWFNYPVYPCDYCQFSAVSNASTGGLFIAEFTNYCASGFRCEWEILLYAASGQLTNFTLELQLISSTQSRIPLPLNTPTEVRMTSYVQLLYQFVLTQLCDVNFTVVATSTSTSFYVAVSRSDWPQDFEFWLEPSEQAAVSTVFSPASPWYYSDQSNVGSPFVATYRLTIWNYLSADANFTMTLATSPYTGPAHTLQPEPLVLGQPFEQSLDVSLQQTRAYYTCQMPAASSTALDMIFSILVLNQTDPTAFGSFSVWWSTEYTLPSDIGYAFTDSCGNSLPEATCIFSAGNGNALQPGQSVYFGIRWDGQATWEPLQISALCNALPRLRLTGQNSTGWQGSAPQGYAALVDLVLPSPASASYLSFVAGVATAVPPVLPLPPLLYWSSSLVGSAASPLPQWSVGADTNYARPTWPTQGVYTAGSYVHRVLDWCVPNALGCVYHFLVFFSQPTSDWQLTVSALSVAAASSPSPQGIPLLQPNSDTGPLSLGVGQVQLFNFTLPAQLMTTAQLTVTVTPLDGGNPDLFLSCLSAYGQWVDPLPINNRALSQYTRWYAQSIHASGPDSISTNASDPRFQSNYYGLWWVLFLTTQWQIAVVGTTAATFSLQLSITGPLPVNDSLGYLAVTPQQNGSANFTQSPANTGLYVYTLIVPDAYSATSDLLVSVLAGSSGYSPSVTLTALQDWPTLEQYSYMFFPANSWLRDSGAGGVSLMINSGTWPSVGPGSVLYLQVSSSAGQPFTVTSSLQPRLSLSLGQAVSASLAAGGARTFNLSLPAVSKGGAWFTTASFLAAVVVTSGAPADAVSPVWLSVTRADNYSTASFNPYGSLNAAYSSAVWASASQMVTVSDVCTGSQCTWTATVYAQSACSFTFAFSPVTAPQRLVPGLPTTSATALPAATAAYYSFSLPHPSMSVTFTLQPAAGASAQFFVSPLYPNPDPGHCTLRSVSSASGLATASLTPATPLPAPDVLNSTWYVAVLGVTGGQYSLLVQAQDAGPRPLFITNDQPVAASVAVGTSAYYQFNIGQVSASTDLSLVLSSNASAAQQPSLYATFSYTEPGPEAGGYLPSFLPYEMFSTSATSSGLQQLTLTQALSSSNVLPLQAQSSLYLAVWGGAATVTAGSGSTQPMLSYALSVSLSARIILAPTPPCTSMTLTRVDPGSVQYWQWSFLPLSATGQQALLVVTGLTSALSALPAVYTADPSISAQVDPTVSSRSYTSSLLPPSASSSSSLSPPLNALMGVLSADCGSFPLSSSCVYKSMVYNALPMAGYAFALSLFRTGDQQQLPSNGSMSQFVQAGQLLFFTFLAPADVTAFNLSLLTSNQDGNADLFVSSSNAHPYAGGAGSSQWSSYAEPLVAGVYLDSVAVSSADAGWQAGGGRYYVSVFGQRAASFTLQLSLLGAPPASPPQTDSSKSSVSTGLTVTLAVLLPLVAVLLLLLFLQRRRLLKRKAALSGDSESDAPGSDESDHSAGEQTGSTDVQMTPRGRSTSGQQQWNS